MRACFPIGGTKRERRLLLPGATAAIAFALLAPTGKAAAPDAAAADHPRGLAARFAQLPKSFWHYLAGVFAHGIGDFVSSVAVGALWSIVGPAAGFLYAGIFALIGAAMVFRWR